MQLKGVCAVASGSCGEHACILAIIVLLGMIRAAVAAGYPERPVRLIVPSAPGGLDASSEQGSRLRDANVRESAAAAWMMAQASIPREQYPSKPVRLIVPSAPGGGTDTSARIIAPKLAEYLGQQVIIDNRAGAGAIIGAELASRAAPDGYTLLMGLSTFTINPAMVRKIPFDFARDFAPISLAVTLPNVLVSHPSLPVKTVRELIAFAKARPGQLQFASAGVGTNPHLTMELFLSMTGLKMIHVPYKGVGPALVDVVAGHVPMMTGNMLSAYPQIKSGRVRAYGVTSARRASGAPEIPTIAEAGVPGYEAVQWYGLLAPAGTPRDIIIKLHGAMVRALHDPDISKRFVSDGAEPAPSASPEEFAVLIRAELIKWAKVVRDAGIEPE